jgi:eukaryotic-like serine/threonine-protein kinase
VRSGAAARTTVTEEPLDTDDRAPLLPLGGRSAGIDVTAARESIAAHRFDPTRLVLLLVAVAIVLGLFVAYRALTRPVDLTAAPDTVATEAPAEDPAAEEPPAEEPAPPAEEPPAAVPPVIASAAQLDPPPGGDQNEHPELVQLGIDGDPSTAWVTRTYNSPSFGGLKPGVGYAVSLAQPATVTTVTLTVLGSGGQVEVRATDPATPTQGDVLASGTLAPETVLTLSAPTETQNVGLWFTSLPQASDGDNRLELAEVTLS